MGLVRPEGAVSNRRLVLITFYLHDSSGDGSLTAIKYEAMIHYCAQQSNQTFETNTRMNFDKSTLGEHWYLLGNVNITDIWQKKTVLFTDSLTCE